MAGRKPIGSFPSSSSSFTADLFGSKDAQDSSSSAGIFSSMFPPPPTAPGRQIHPSSSRNGTWQSEPSKSQGWKPRSGNSVIKKDGDMSSGESIFQQERVEPCHLSSSIYYGGQDIFSRHPSSHSSDSYPTFKKDGEEDDSNGSNSQAHRGNWWQGSLYY